MMRLGMLRLTLIKPYGKAICHAGKGQGAVLLKKIFLCLLLSWTIFLSVSQAEAREIADMTGRLVVVPDRISRVFATSPPGTYLLYAIDPSVIAGLNFPLWENEKKYTVKRLQNLPVIGGVVGQGRSINQEVLLSVRPDLIIIWSWKDTALNKQYEDIFTRLRIPWVNISLDSIEQYPDALSFMGTLLNKEERGQRLARYAKESLREVKAVVDKIPRQERLRVYYAEGPDGLATEGEGSVHAELIPMAGGINVHRGNSPDRYGMEKVSLEQVMAYNPDVILVKERLFLDAIFKDPRWKNIKAVKERRVYFIPYQPFNWFDRPP
ncbi:MAG: ABC transporter substrate-binding protein, partial [Thermodesulfovibrionales bacterium]